MKKVLISLALLAALIGCKNESKSPTTPPSTQAPTIVSPQPPLEMTEFCYQFTKNGDTISCQIAVNDAGDFNGYYAWMPSEKDGRLGLLTGKNTFGNDTLVANFKYIQEGEVSTEEMVFVKLGDKLINLESTIFDKNGNMVMTNRKKLKAGDTLLKVDCAKLKNIVTYIKEDEKHIREAK
jgi:hypothetical protein